MPHRSISPDMLLPELLREHPETRGVFDHYGLRGCGGKLGPVESIRFFARAHGVELGRLIAELDSAIANPQSAAAAEAATAADSIYRRYFLAGIALILTAGATWGAYLLWTIGLGGSFTAVSIHAVNAHGHAQIYGWVGLFIMGFSLQAFPRMWHTSLAWPRLGLAAFGLMVAGLIVRTIGMTSAGAPWALSAALAGAAFEIVSVLLYTACIFRTFLNGEGRRDWKSQPYLGFAFSALFYFVFSSLFCAWHMWNTMMAANATDLTWYVATYQAPLRDMQIHGLALCMILGVSLRMLPGLFEVPEISARRAWIALGFVNAGVIGETVLFIVYRMTKNHALAALLLVCWLALAIGAAMVALPWKLWRPFNAVDRSGKFVRAAYGWLAISLVMLLLLPVYQHISGLAFSHAYYGAVRHAITVGFISLMIMGFAAKVVPTLNGLDVRALSALWLPFALVNLGCALRVSFQILTDWNPAFFSLVGISGVLEVTGLAIWGYGLAKIMLSAPAQNEALGPKPHFITADLKVADVLAWFPETEDAFVAQGFGLLKNPVLRRTVARHTTLSQAAKLKGVQLDGLLEALNSRAGLKQCGGCQHA